MTRQRLSSSLFSRVSSRAEAIFICRGSMRFIIRLASLHEHSRIFFFPLAAFSCRFPPLGKDRRLFFVSPSATTDRWKWTIKRPTIPPGIVCFTLAGEKGEKKREACRRSMINSLAIDMFRYTSLREIFSQAEEDF